MSALVFGVGVGLFLLVALWVAAFLLCVVSLRANQNAGFLAVLSAVLLTTLLTALPIDSPLDADLTQPTWVPKVYDHFFIWRIVLVAFLLVSVAGGSISFVYTHLMEAQFAKPLEKPLRTD